MKSLILVLLGFLLVCAKREGQITLDSLYESEKSDSFQVNMVALRAEFKEFAKANAFPVESLLAVVPAFRYRAKISYLVTEGEATRLDLSEEMVLKRNKSGDFHLWHENSKDEGREVYWVNGALFVKEKQGELKRFDKSRETPSLFLEETLSGWADLLASVYYFLDYQFKDETKQADRPVIGFTLRYGKSRAKSLKTKPTAAERFSFRDKWLRYAKPVEIDGQVYLDKEKGFMVSGRLDVRYQIETKGQKQILAVHFDGGFEEIGQPLSFEVAKSVPEIRRLRLTHEKRLLLGEEEEEGQPKAKSKVKAFLRKKLDDDGIGDDE